MRAVLLIATALALASSSVADHSASPCASDVTSIGTGEHVLYLIQDAKDDQTWIYEESNGHAGLQRGGVGWYEFGTHGIGDECWDRDLATGEEIVDPDVILF